MPKKSKKLCIYCLAQPGVTRDHVLPQAWYPDGTSPKVQRWKAPACEPCNSRLKKAEEQVALMVVMASGFDHTHPAVAGVFERVRKTWNAADTKDEQEAEKRSDRLESILGRLQLVVAGPAEMQGAARMQVQTEAGLLVAAVGLRGRNRDVSAVVEKFVRGLHYYLTNKTPLPATAKIIPFKLTAEVQRWAIQQFPLHSSSDGLLYRVGQAQGREWWFFLLWGQVELAAYVELDPWWRRWWRRNSSPYPVMALG